MNREGRARQAPSWRIGGPATFSGTGYQIEVIVKRLLIVISEYGVDASLDRGLSVESRVLTEDGSESFDFSIHPEKEHVEVKIAPTRAEVTEWIKSSCAALEQEPDSTGTLVVARTTPAVADVEEIVRQSREAVSDAHLRELIDMESSELKALVDYASPHALARLRRLSVAQIGDEALRLLNEAYARVLAGNRSRDLLNLLRSEALNAAKTRETLWTQNLVSKIEGQGITLRRFQPGVDIEDSAARAVFCLVSLCPRPLPISLLAKLLEFGESDVRRATEFLIARSLVILENDVILRYPIEANLVNNEIGKSVARSALRGLLSIARDKDNAPLVRNQLRNIAALGEAAIEVDPELVSSILPTIDKVAKSAGDLYLVLKLARMSNRAAVRTPLELDAPSKQMLMNKAQTLICGTSWVYQRIGRLGRAREDAEASLNLGQELGWHRNTAFCFKCIGRLNRLEAEASSDLAERSRLLGESEKSLMKALDYFEGRVPEFEANMAEAGDCHSLLGRTYLVAHRKRAAEIEVARAHENLDAHPETKDWCDLLLLEAELELADRNFERALSITSDVIAADLSKSPESSEIVARAFRTKGEILRTNGHPQAAAKAFDESARHYKELMETKKANWASYEAMKLRGEIPTDLASHLPTNDPSTSIEAIGLFQSRMASQPKSVRSRRSGAPAAFFDQLIADAKLAARSKEHDWE